jgi:hypothetical protein
MPKNWFFILFFISTTLFAQVNTWKGYFSYKNIIDISGTSNTIYAAAENAIFYKNNENNELITKNSIDGLVGFDISAIYQSTTYQKTLIGYSNGYLVEINNVTNKISKNIYILNYNNGVSNNKKRINHFYEFGNKAYISTDFGVVEYNLANSTFGDTFFISPTGVETEVTSTTVVGNTIYACTRNHGIRSANVNSQFLVNYQNWTVFDGGFWKKILNFNNSLIGLNTSNIVYRNNGIFMQLATSTDVFTDIKNTNNYLTLITSNNVFVYDQDFILKRQVNKLQVPNFTGNFKSAIVVGTKLMISTNNAGLIEVGLFANDFNFVVPNGPEYNKIFSVTASPKGKIWAVYGDYDVNNNPYPLDDFGISIFNQNQWKYIKNSTLNNYKSIVRVSLDPKNEDIAYVSSYFNGLIKMVNEVPTQFYNHTNGLESLVLNGNPNYKDTRVENVAFDSNGGVWTSISLISNMLRVLRPDNTWSVFNFSNEVGVDTHNFRLAIDKNNTKWLGTIGAGVLIFNENGNKKQKLTDSENDNLPTSSVPIVAIDKKNQAWIGTRNGLRIIKNVDDFINQETISATNIVIEEDGLGQELMYRQHITDIVVDGANNKWIATADAGVFLVSPNGQKTIHHFTLENSPLPSDTVYDIDINSTTGEVFFVTSRGMVSFGGLATATQETLENVYIFPNPVRPEYTGTVKITQLTDKANVKITDIEGNLVFEKTSDSGTIEWDTTAFGKYKVASGVFMVFLSSKDGTDTQVRKLMIVR